MIISRLIEFLDRNATLKTALFLMMAIIPMNALVYPLINDAISGSSGLGRLETTFTFTPAQLYQRLEAYGEAGRQTYLLSIAAVDFLFPILYSLLLGFLLTILLRVAFPSEHPLSRMQLFPFGMLIFNYLYNLAMMVQLFLYPVQPGMLAWFISAMNTIKWCFGGFSLAALLIVVFRLLTLSSKKNNSQGA